jgi:hypothetical protein
MEDSAVGDHVGNGAIETTVKQFQGQFRAMKSALQERCKCTVKSDHESVPWSVSHVAATINRRRRDNSGMTR